MKQAFMEKWKWSVCCWMLVDMIHSSRVLPLIVHWSPVGIDVSITDSSGGTAVDILEGHNAKKAIEIRTLLKGL